jgi:hypothetical protein
MKIYVSDARAIADSQKDLHGKAQEGFYTKLLEQHDSDIDPLTDLIAATITTSNGENRNEVLEDALSTLDYQIGEMSRARDAISNLCKQ